MKKIFIILPFVTLLFFSCKQEKKQVEDKPAVLGKYVYMTDNGVLHSTRDCINVRYAKDEDGHKVYGMEFMDTVTFAPEYKFSYCTRCFSEMQYEQLEKILERNTQCVYDSVVSDEY